MYRFTRIVLLICGILMQAAAVVMFGFTEIPVSDYTYMIIWVLCGLLIKYSLNTIKAN